MVRCRASRGEATWEKLDGKAGWDVPYGSGVVGGCAWHRCESALNDGTRREGEGRGLMGREEVGAER